ncbi:MAG: hypothetical protein WA364_11205 [Candidatus Nitrosopolaris sp.]
MVYGIYVLLDALGTRVSVKEELKEKVNNFDLIDDSPNNDIKILKRQIRGIVIMTRFLSIRFMIISKFSVKYVIASYTHFYVTFVIAVGTVAAIMLTALTVRVTIADATRCRKFRICWKRQVINSWHWMKASNPFASLMCS